MYDTKYMEIISHPLQSQRCPLGGLQQHQDSLFSDATLERAYSNQAATSSETKMVEQPFAKLKKCKNDRA
jgi:hypothetical protein